MTANNLDGPVETRPPCVPDWFACLHHWCTLTSSWSCSRRLFCFSSCCCWGSVTLTGLRRTVDVLYAVSPLHLFTASGEMRWISDDRSMTILPTSGGFSSWESNFLFLDLSADWCLFPPMCFQLPRPLFFKKNLFLILHHLHLLRCHVTFLVRSSPFGDVRFTGGRLEGFTARPLRWSPTVVPPPLPPALVDSGGVTLPPHPGAALTPFDFSQNGALSDFYEAQSGTVLGS